MEYEINSGKIIVQLKSAKIETVVGDAARMDCQRAINYIKSGQAELQPLVESAKNYAEQAAASAATASNMANKDLSNLSAAGEAKFDAKQDVISDLSTIRSGAALGATAVQPSDLATVATTGDYDDLLDKPTIPTVNNATLTITQGGVSKGTFTANASSNVTIALDAGSGGVWGNITGDIDDQTDLKNALDAKYDASNPDGYTSNVGTVTSVNNVSPDGNGNVTLTASDVGAATTTDLSGKVSKTGDTMTGNLRISSGLICLEGIGSSVSLSTSKLVLGTPTNQYSYLTGNNQGAFGIYSEVSGTRKGIACYPTQNFFADATTKTIDLGRSNNVWKTGFINTLSDGSNSISTANIVSGIGEANSALQPNDNISELTNDVGYITLSALSGYATESYVDTADNNLQGQIDAIVASSDVFDIVGTYAELQAYDISTVPVNDIIKVLVDSTHENAATYYRCVETGGVKSWSYIGTEGAYYTKAQSDARFATAAQGAKADTAVQPSDLATVATSGSYNDLLNKPTIPTDTADLTNGAGYITSSALSGYQTTANLVTSVSGSSTDSQYPSAKLFYDTCGDIETLINAL